MFVLSGKISRAGTAANGDGKTLANVLAAIRAHARTY